MAVFQAGRDVRPGQLSARLCRPEVPSHLLQVADPQIFGRLPGYGYGFAVAVLHPNIDQRLVLLRVSLQGQPPALPHNVDIVQARVRECSWSRLISTGHNLPSMFLTIMSGPSRMSGTTCNSKSGGFPAPRIMWPQRLMMALGITPKATTKSVFTQVEGSVWISRQRNTRVTTRTSVWPSKCPEAALTASPMISFRRMYGTIEGSGMRASGTQSLSVSGGSNVSNFKSNSPGPGQPVLSL